jgi:hypothetical protein
MKVGRNAPCPCGSDKKFKNCCGGANGKATRDWSGLGLTVIGLVLLFGLLGMVVSFINSDGVDTSGMVWSEEHGHWHTSDGRELGGGGPRPQPPGPAPAGKVWSPEHGHWHDAD